MPWYAILKTLFEYLKGKEVADITQMGIPEAGSLILDGKTAVFISRVSEKNLDVYHGGTGTVSLEVGFFVTDKGATDFASGYEKLSALEKKVQDVIEEWAGQDMPVEDLDVMQVRITNAGGNPYCERPLIGSYLDIEIEWSLRTL